MRLAPDTELQSRCDLLRSLHRPGAPPLLPNATAGFDVVATTSVGVAAGLGWGAARLGCRARAAEVADR